jgi:hypothetical protein
METITTLELSNIIKMHKYTLQSYLSNYRFNKYRITEKDGLYALYNLSNMFLNIFYNFLLMRNRYNQAKMLKDHFKDFNFKIMSYEDFLQC